LTLNPITVVDHVLGEYRSYLSTEFQARDPQLRPNAHPGGPYCFCKDLHQTFVLDGITERRAQAHAGTIRLVPQRSR
jgi:hypothetical protein